MGGPLVVVTDSVFPDLEPARKVLAPLDAELRLADAPTTEAITAAAREADALLVTYAPVGADIIDELQRCRIIARFGIGVDNVDIGAATQKGIVVTRVPDYCIDEVSDHALALLLALARKVTEANEAVQAGKWSVSSVAPLRRLRGRTLGLVGFGQIPRTLAPKAQAFGLRVIAYDPYIAEALAAEQDVELVSLEELLQHSAYISVHAPLTEETLHMFNANTLRQMQPGALLVNTARGPLVDEEALVGALDEGHLGGAALDVLPHEPLDPNSPLLGRADIILTPHVAFYSEEALRELQSKAAQEVASVLTGQAPRYPVNPEVLDHRQET
jgi:D-3-phosphoglycerate dehydrogenase / 2-oxoglutarate reductase